MLPEGMWRISRMWGLDSKHSGVLGYCFSFSMGFSFSGACPAISRWPYPELSQPTCA